MSKIIEVTFSVGPFQMAGQIDYPEGDGPFPIVLISPGMPQHDRYGNVRGYPGYNNYFVPLTERLLNAGYAVMRYDKGGTGESSSGLSAEKNMVEAYRTMVNQDNVDREKVAILAISAGSAHVYRKLMELEEINPIQQLALLSTGVNDLKLEALEFPILLVAGAGRILRSKQALDRYEEQKGFRTKAYEAEEANEQLCDESHGKASLFKENGCEWHEGALNVIEDWFSSFA